MKSHRFLSLAAVAIVLLLSPVEGQAASSRWEVTEGGRLRIVTEAWDRGRSDLRAALQIDLAPGWKTYWREPGSAGIPPSISFAGDAIREAALHYPAPVWIDDPYGSWAGYTEPVSLPLVLELDPAAESGSITAEIFLGICSDVCIPVAAQLEVDILDGNAAAMHGILVSSAHAALPHSGDDRLSVTGANRLLEGDLEVAVNHPERAADDVELFLSAGPGRPFAKPEAVSRQSGRTVFHVRPATPAAMDGAFDLLVTARAGGDAVETTIAIDAP